MKTMKKIVAILAVALMLCSILPMAVFAAESTVSYDFSTFSGSSTQYAQQSHDLGNGLNVSMVGCHINTQLRFYNSQSSVEAIFNVTDKEITSMTLNAGYKAGNMTVSTSADGATWSDAGSITTTTSYTNYTVNFDPSTKYVKLGKGTGTAQIRIKTVSFTVVDAAGGEEPPVTCEHVWVDADCTTPKTCSLCGETEGEALGHSYGEGEQTAAPDCTNAGEMKYTCSACGDVKTETVNALGHTYVDGTCSVCGATEPNEAEATIPLIATTGALADDSLSISWTDGTIQFVNYKGGTAIRTSDTDHYRCYAGSKIVISGKNGETMTQVQITATSSSYATALANSGASEGWTVSVDGSVVTYTSAGATELVIESVSAQARCNSAVITYNKGAGSDEPPCEHTNAVACDKTCPDCGVQLNADAACVSDAAYACHEGNCIYCGEPVEPADHQWNEDDVCTVCGLAPTPENPVDPSNPQEYVFADFAAGEQYAEGEKHYLDNAVTVITTQAHFTTELRVYSSSTHDGNVVIKSKKDISAIVLNAGNKVDVLNLYVSADGEVYEAVEITATSYNDYTVLIPEMTRYIKLDVAGENQVRIAKMTLYFDGEEPVCEHQYANEYDTTCDLCGEVRDVVAPAGVITFGGNSVSEDVNGLAFKFTMAIDGIAAVNGNVADYTNATINGYTVIGMGAKAANAISEIDIPCVYLLDLEANSAAFAVRIINIPDANLSDDITVTPYYIVEIDGVQQIIYGDAQIASYNG